MEFFKIKIKIDLNICLFGVHRLGVLSKWICWHAVYFILSMPPNPNAFYELGKVNEGRYKFMAVGNTTNKLDVQSPTVHAYMRVQMRLRPHLE